jgi:hypothetical protein
MRKADGRNGHRQDGHQQGRDQRASVNAHLAR